MKKSVREINAMVCNDVRETVGNSCFSYITAPKEKASINWIFNYAREKGNTELSDVYGSYSSAKYRAFLYCKDLCEKLNGTDFYIASHNCMFFSVVFRFTHPTTGHECIAYITRSYDRFCDYNHALR